MSEEPTESGVRIGSSAVLVAVAFPFVCLGGFLAFVPPELLGGWLTDLFGTSIRADLQAAAVDAAIEMGTLLLVLAVAIPVLVHLLRDRVGGAVASLERSVYGSNVNFSDGAMALATLGLLFVFDWQALAYGFFRYDDFHLVRYATVTPLPEQLLRAYNGHLFPLFWIQLWVMESMVGVAPFAYNVWTLATVGGCWYLGASLLRDMGTSAFGIASFMAVCASWSNWGDVTGGYYCVLLYVEILLLWLLGVRCYLRAERDGRPRLKWITASSVVLAHGLGLVGAWTGPAMILFILCTSWRRGLGWVDAILALWKSDRLLVATCIASPVAYFAVAMAVGNTVVSDLGGAGGGLQIFDRALQVVLFVLHGLWSTMFLPHSTYFDGSPLLNGVWTALTLISFGGVVVLGLRQCRPAQRWQIAALMGGCLAICALVALGRPGVVTRIEPKYSVPAYVLFCAAGALMLDEFVRSSAPVRLARMKLSMVLVLGLVGAQLLAERFDTLIMTMDDRFPSDSRAGSFAAARERRAAVEKLSEVFDDLAAAGPIRLPTVTTPFMNSAFRPLVWDFSNYLGFIESPERLELFRTPSMRDRISSDRDVRTVADLRRHVSPAFLDALRVNPRLQAVYNAPIRLEVLSPEDGAAEARVPLIRRTESSWASASPFDPMALPNLEFELADGAFQEPTMLLIEFEGDLGVSSVKYEVDVTGRSRGRIDLLYLPAFALNERIQQLEITRVGAGTRIADLRLSSRSE